jgi:hypothetical protein
MASYKTLQKISEGCILVLRMAALVPGLEGSTILEQMQKLFEPPGGEQTLR